MFTIESLEIRCIPAKLRAIVRAPQKMRQEMWRSVRLRPLSPSLRQTPQVRAPLRGPVRGSLPQAVPGVRLRRTHGIPTSLQRGGRGCPVRNEANLLHRKKLYALKYTLSYLKERKKKT